MLCPQPLEDPDQAEYWSNIVVTLCIVGGPDVVEPIVEFIGENGPSARRSNRQSSSSVT